MTTQPYQVLLADGRMYQKFETMEQAVKCADKKSAQYIHDAATKTTWQPKPGQKKPTFSAGVVRKGSTGGKLVVGNPHRNGYGCVDGVNGYCTVKHETVAQPATVVKPAAPAYRKFSSKIEPVCPVVPNQAHEARKAAYVKLQSEAYQASIGIESQNIEQPVVTPVVKPISQPVVIPIAQPYMVVLSDGRLWRKFDDIYEAIACAYRKSGKLKIRGMIDSRLQITLRANHRKIFA